MMQKINNKNAEYLAEAPPNLALRELKCLWERRGLPAPFLVLSFLITAWLRLFLRGGGNTCSDCPTQTRKVRSDSRSSARPASWTSMDFSLRSALLRFPEFQHLRVNRRQIKLTILISRWIKKRNRVLLLENTDVKFCEGMFWALFPAVLSVSAVYGSASDVTESTKKTPKLWIFFFFFPTPHSAL